MGVTKSRDKTAAAAFVTNGRVRDLALFDCGIDVKLRGCELVKLRVSDVAPRGSLHQRATVIQQQTGRPAPLEITATTREGLTASLAKRGRRGRSLLPAKCGNLTFSGTLADHPPAGWKGQIDQYYFTNSPFPDELFFFHRASRTAIIADLSQTFSDAFLRSHWPWWMRPAARLSRMVEGCGYPPIDYRISFRDRASARPKIQALIKEHPEHVLVAHGEVVTTGGEAFLLRAFSWLLRSN